MNMWKSETNLRYIKKYTVKEWKRFDIDTQEILCKKYNVFLTDYKTTREKKIAIVKRIGKIVGVISVQTYKALRTFEGLNKPKQYTRRKSKRRSKDVLK